MRLSGVRDGALVVRSRLCKIGREGYRKEKRRKGGVIQSTQGWQSGY